MLQKTIQQSREKSPGNIFSEAIGNEIKAAKSLSESLQISEKCASCILYLRGTVRHSKEAEAELIRRDRTGENLPNIYEWPPKGWKPN